MPTNWKQLKAIEQKNKELILEYSDFKDESGIYVFTRIDENGLKYAYVGKAQTQGVLTRMAQHLSGYKQHIDLSIRRHGLWRTTNTTGWLPSVEHYCQPNECDTFERQSIIEWAQAGYQLRNVESGGTLGKTDINDRKPARGYRDGVKQGERNVIKQIAHLFDKHIKAVYKAYKPSKNAIKALDKFYSLIQGEQDD